METQQMVRFLFGSGWWIAWHGAFYLAILVFVVLTLAIFATELRPAGVKPNLPSPGSFMVFVIALTMAGLTLVNASILVFHLAWPWYADVVFVLGAVAITFLIGGVLNNYLAVDQGYPAFWLNVGYVLLSSLGNLVMMSRFER
jgi:hypothetical protein